MSSKRSFLSVTDLSPDDIREVLDRGAGLKTGRNSRSLAGKTAVLLFEKPSLRTKLSFEVGVGKLGGRVIYFSPQEVGIDKRESAEDIAHVVSRMADVAIVRTFSQALLDRFEAASSIPVINALTDEEHPCQALADLLTIHERFGHVQNVHIAFVGDGNNVAASLALAVASLGGTLTLASPPKYRLPDSVFRQASAIGVRTGATIDLVDTPAKAVEGADVVYTDVWTSMGQEAESAQRRQDFSGFQVDAHLMELAAPHAVFMHDLPAHRGEEVATEVIDGPRSVIFDQAENRLHAQAGLLDFLFSG